MKTAPRLSLLLTLLLGFALQGLGQGSLARYSTPARDAIGRTKSLASPALSGFTISARREFDRNLAINVSSATRSWFLDSYALGEAQVATAQYKSSATWASIGPANPSIGLMAAGRSTSANSVNSSARSLNNATASPGDEGELTSWMQSNIRFANADPRPE